MHLVRTVSELHATLQPWRAAREAIALVPTMGNLHAGHLCLMETARAVGECVVVSVFVNPLQFGPGEDFEKYPRTLAADRVLLEKTGVNVLFAPTVQDLYPGGYPPATAVSVHGPLAEILCAPFRPGHFDGVATVVNILFNLVTPAVAVFGEKDYQQLAIIRQMVADFGSSVRVVGVPTLREPDGLAMSSRNQYLSAEERRRAPRLIETLNWAGEQLNAGRRDFAVLAEEACVRLTGAGFKPQYLDIRARDLAPPTTGTRMFVVLAAAYLGRTRLIDNLSIGPVLP
ncbi:MAG: pantoate--beta-alanine ligase [Nevskiales bacterium]|nr:pantoate--beta-alanine ligase [Nevskiales bacterium]